jgi:hypothetical protein
MLLGLLGLLTVAAVACGPAAAQAPRSPPVFDQLASPFTETEIGGFGCLTATAVSGIGIVALLGGPGALLSAVRGLTLQPRTVLEASAAIAFVFSSACYVGQALAPVVSLGITEMSDSLADQ